MRIDVYLVKNNIFDSRTKASQAIDRGEVFVDGKKVLKASFEVVEDCQLNVEIVREKSFVSLGGYKLEKALDDFNFNVNGLVVADVGASTGGFTDCLLQHGAKRVYAVDLNDGLLSNKLKNDDRVISVIKNARNLTTNDFSDKLDLIVADLSFISATQVLNIFSELIENGKHVILLIKPQFEIGGKKRFKNGIIRDEKIRKEACDNILAFAESCGLAKIDFTTAPINQDKNVEYLILLKKTSLKS